MADEVAAPVPYARRQVEKLATGGTCILWRVWSGWRVRCLICKFRAGVGRRALPWEVAIDESEAHTATHDRGKRDALRALNKMRVIKGDTV